MPGQNIPYADPTPEPNPGLTARLKELTAQVNAGYRQQIEREVRAKVAEELRADAAAHRRLVTRKPSAYDEARLARAKTLDDAAARVTRGGQCDEHWWEVRSLTGPPAPYGPCTKCGTPHPEASL